MPLFVTEEASHGSPVLPPGPSKVWRVFLSVEMLRVTLLVWVCLGCGHGWQLGSGSLGPLRRSIRGWWRLCSGYRLAGWDSKAAVSGAAMG